MVATESTRALEAWLPTPAATDVCGEGGDHGWQAVERRRRMNGVLRLKLLGQRRLFRDLWAVIGGPPNEKRSLWRVDMTLRGGRLDEPTFLSRPTSGSQAFMV